MRIASCKRFSLFYQFYYNYYTYETCKYCVLYQRKKLLYKYIVNIVCFIKEKSYCRSILISLWKFTRKFLQILGEGLQMSEQNQMVVDLVERRLQCSIFLARHTCLSLCRNNQPINVVDACAIIYTSNFLYLKLLWFIFRVSFVRIKNIVGGEEDQCQVKDCL